MKHRTAPYALHTCQTEGRLGGRAFTRRFLDAVDTPRRRFQLWPWWNNPAQVTYLRQHPTFGPDKVAALLRVYAYREPEETEEDAAWSLHLSLVSLEAWQNQAERLLLRKDRPHETADVHGERTA